MKANEAPEKIYVDADENWHRTHSVFTEKAKGNDIEYTRTDAFIKKACEWFRSIDYDDSLPPFETTEEFIEGFKKAMAI